MLASVASENIIRRILVKVPIGPLLFQRQKSEFFEKCHEVLTLHRQDTTNKSFTSQSLLYCVKSYICARKTRHT